MTVLDLVILARTTPVEKPRFLVGLGGAHHAEYLADCVKSALFVSKGHRPGTRLHIVMEAGRGFPRTLTLDGDALGDLGDLTETGIVHTLADALDQSRTLALRETVVLASGIRVTGLGFSPMLGQLTETRGDLSDPRYLLQPEGSDIRTIDHDRGGVFVMSDHVPMPGKIAKSLIRRGFIPLSVGPGMLQTSQCITLIHNEFDRSRLT